MKAMCLFLSLSVLIAGCYSEVPLPKGTRARESRDAKFILKDGSRIESRADSHYRISGGYQISGKRITADGEEREFTGVVHDPDIDRIEVHEINEAVVTASVGIGLAILITVFALNYNSSRGSIF